MKSILLFVILWFSIGIAFSQNRSISGSIQDEKGIPIPQVQISIKGSQKTQFSSSNGKFELEVTLGSKLVFSHLGYITQVFEIIEETAEEILIILKTSKSLLEEVVITAQNFKKPYKILAYGNAKITAKQITQRPQQDIVRALQGKIAGVNILPTSGLSGSGTSINIRGLSSINQNNQPLFVIDGVPFNSTTNILGGESGFIHGANSTPSRFLDIDLNEIEQVEVLKGLGASILYGESGRNGVILINTKKAIKSKKKDWSVSFTQSVYMTQISDLPEYQNAYGQGFDNSEDISVIGNWGARFDQNIEVLHHFSTGNLATIFPEFKDQTESYRPFKNNVKDFFRTGIGRNTSVGLSKSSKETSLNARFSHTDEDGFIPENNLKKLNLSIGGSAKLGKHLNFDGKVHFIRTKFKTPPTAAAISEGLSVLERTFFIPRNYDLTGLPSQNPFTGTSIFYRPEIENPYWVVQNAQINQGVDRFFSTTNLSYQLNPYTKLLYRLGVDTYAENQSFFINKGGASNLQAQEGYYRTTSSTYESLDHSFILSSKFKISKKWNMDALLGFNIKGNTYKQTGTVSQNQFAFGVIDHNNFQSQSNIDPFGADLDFNTQANFLGLYSQIVLGYNNMAFLTLSGRNDWSSVVEKQHQSILYPGVGLSIIPTKIFPNLANDILNFLKIRTSYATSAGFPDPFLTRRVLAINGAAFTTESGEVISTNTNRLSNTIGGTLPAPDLKPELHREIEFGLDTHLWKHRISLNTSVYHRISKDQIVQQFLDASSGFDNTFVNIGEIENKGIELNLGIVPIQISDHFKWNTNFIFNAYKAKVNKLPEGVERIVTSGFTNLGNVAIEGKPLGVIIGSRATRNNQGELLINPTNGKIITNAELGLDDEIIGDPNPDYTLTNIHNFSFKNFQLGIQLDFVKGGDIYSATVGNLLRRGVTKDTENREGTVVLDGVLADPTTGEVLQDENGSPQKNNIQLNLNDVYFQNLLEADDQLIFDATIFRLREISLGYDFPKKFLNNTPLGTLSIGVYGQNLFFVTPNIPKYTNFDPEVLSTGVGNGRGLDFQTTPNSRKFGFTLQATF